MTALSITGKTAPTYASLINKYISYRYGKARPQSTISSFIKIKHMIITYNKAEIVEDENGKKFLHLELQAFIPGTNVIIQNIFPATSNFDPLELLQSGIDADVK